MQQIGAEQTGPGRAHEISDISEGNTRQLGLLNCLECGRGISCEAAMEVSNLIAQERHRDKFICPECAGVLEKTHKHVAQGRAPDQLVVCIWHVPSMTREAEGFRLAIEGALISFGKEVIAECQHIETVQATNYFAGLLTSHNIKPNAALLVCVITEAPQGSENFMVVRSEGRDGRQQPEELANIYKQCFTALDLLHGGFMRRTVLQLASGVRLSSEGVGKLQTWLNQTHVVDEIVTPTNAMFQPARILGFTLNLALLLYSKGDDITNALPKAWLLDESGREHTGLLLLSPGKLPSTYIWSPFDRPFGQGIYYCDCEQGKAVWKQKHSGSHQSSDSGFNYVCTKCGNTFKVVLPPGTSFTRVETLGTAYVKCQWPVPALGIIPTIRENQPPSRGGASTNLC